jgi:Zn-dependent alcohol dehydrogenase
MLLRTLKTHLGLLSVVVLTVLFMAPPTLMIGCTADQLSSADRSIGGTPLVATTAPTSQPGVYTTVQPSNAQLTIHLLSDAASEAAPVVTAVAPQPWGALAGTILGLLGVGLAAFQTSSANKANTRANVAENVVAAAAPGVAHIVNQITDNKTLNTDVTTLGQIAPGVIALLAHPTATSVLQATGQVVGALTTTPVIVAPPSNPTALH